MYRVDALRTPTASGLLNPTPVEGEVRFFQAQDKPMITTRPCL